MNSYERFIGYNVNIFLHFENILKIKPKNLSFKGRNQIFKNTSSLCHVTSIFILLSEFYTISVSEINNVTRIKVGTCGVPNHQSFEIFFTFKKIYFTIFVKH